MDCLSIEHVTISETLLHGSILILVDYNQNIVITQCKNTNSSSPRLFCINCQVPLCSITNLSVTHFLVDTWMLAHIDARKLSVAL